MERERRVRTLLGLILLLLFEHASCHRRQKRFFWITNDGRIALPPGTVMTITPTLALPFVRYPPRGFLSNMTISLPFTIDFDKLGLTDNENPYGVLSSGFEGARSGSEHLASKAEFVAAFVKREADRPANEMFHAFHGGERALLYGTAEDMLGNFGMNGKACLLRAICEVQGHSLSNFGLIGEMLRLFFTASKSPFASLLEEYVEAENRGKFHGECWPYFKDCPKSLFLPSENRYTKDAGHETTDASVLRNAQKTVLDRIETNLKTDAARDTEPDTAGRRNEDWSNVPFSIEEQTQRNLRIPRNANDALHPTIWKQYCRNYLKQRSASAVILVYVMDYLRHLAYKL